MTWTSCEKINEQIDILDERLTIVEEENQALREQLVETTNALLQAIQDNSSDIGQLDTLVDQINGSLELLGEDIDGIREDMISAQQAMLNALAAEINAIRETIDQENANTLALLDAVEQELLNATNSLGSDLQATNDAIASVVSEVAEVRVDIIAAQQEVLETLQSELDDVREQSDQSDAETLALLVSIQQELSNAIESLGDDIQATNAAITSAVANLNTAIEAVPDVCDIESGDYEEMVLPDYYGKVQVYFYDGAGNTILRWVARFGDETFDVNDIKGRWRLLDDEGYFEGSFKTKLSHLKTGIDNNTVNFDSWGEGDAPPGAEPGDPKPYTKDDPTIALELSQSVLMFGSEIDTNSNAGEIKFEWNPTTGFYRGCFDGDFKDIKWYVNGIFTSGGTTFFQDIGDKADTFIITVNGTLPDGTVVWGQHEVEIEVDAKGRVRRGRVVVRRPV